MYLYLCSNFVSVVIYVYTHFDTESLIFVTFTCYMYISIRSDTIVNETTPHKRPHGKEVKHDSLQYDLQQWAKSIQHNLLRKTSK